MNLWLDDMRPAPAGWYWAKTVDDAKKFILTHPGQIDGASLDHDLGACPACMGGQSEEDWLRSTNFEQMPNCEHFGTGYTLLLWMEETGNWPINEPRVHSRNADGAARMRQVINRVMGSRVMGSKIKAPDAKP